MGNFNLNKWTLRLLWISVVTFKVISSFISMSKCRLAWNFPFIVCICFSLILSFESRKQSESNCIKWFSTITLKYNSLACYFIFLLFLGGNKMSLQLSSRQLFYYILFPSACWRKHWRSSPFPLLQIKISHSLCCSPQCSEQHILLAFQMLITGFGLGQMCILLSVSREGVTKNRGLCTAAQINPTSTALLSVCPGCSDCLKGG